MNAGEMVAAPDFPPAARVDQRVPKELLLENGAPTAAGRRHISEGIEEFLWLAALKPTTIGVPHYRDEVREYLEIAVLRLALRPGAKAPAPCLRRTSAGPGARRVRPCWTDP